MPEKARNTPKNTIERPVTDLIATTADGRDITRGFIDQLDYLAPDDPILRERCRGDLEIYERLLDDDQVAATFEQRCLSVVAHEWTVEPASEETRDVEAADWLREALSEVNFDEATRQMLSAILLGFSVAECDWEMREGKVWLRSLLVRRQKRFAFSPKGELLLRTSRSPRGELMPERKFWVHRCGGPHADDYYGRGIGGRLYWPCFFKRNGLRFWMAFLDRFGSPSTIATVPPGASDADVQKATELVSAIQRDTGAVVPEGIALSLLESARSAGGDFGAFCERMDAAISKVVLGQTMTTDDGSSLAQSKTHLTVRDQMLKADADALCESFNNSVVSWLTDWNFPGARPPKVWRKFEEPADIASLADTDVKLYQCGWQRTPESMTEVFGEGYREAEKAPAEEAPGPAFAEEDEETPDEKAEDILSALMEEVRALVAGCATLEELRERLSDVRADFGGRPELLEALSEALTASELKGRRDVAAALGIAKGA